MRAAITQGQREPHLISDGDAIDLDGWITRLGREHIPLDA
jgi:hypothetical protein